MTPLVRRIVALRNRVPWWVQVPVLGVAGAVLFGLPTLREVNAVRDRPIEHAEVVAVDDRSGLFSGCGKGDGPPAQVTWRSSDPPTGRPATFTGRDSCDGDVAVGETHRVVRVGETVYVEPATTWGQVWLMAGVGAGAIMGAVALVLGGRAVLSRWFQPAWQRRRNGREFA